VRVWRVILRKGGVEARRAAPAWPSGYGHGRAMAASRSSAAADGPVLPARTDRRHAPHGGLSGLISQRQFPQLPKDKVAILYAFRFGI
jgi:hypothetical protein